MTTTQFLDNGRVALVNYGKSEAQYIRHGACYFTKDTHPDVIAVLLAMYSTNRRIRVHYGHTNDVVDPTVDRPTVDRPGAKIIGRDWLEEWDVTGYVGRTSGPLFLPMLLSNRRSSGGVTLLTSCIVKIRLARGGGVLYQHPRYHHGVLTIREVGAGDTSLFSTSLVASGYTHNVCVDDQVWASFKGLEKALRYIKHITGRAYAGAVLPSLNPIHDDGGRTFRCISLD